MLALFAGLDVDDMNAPAVEQLHPIIRPTWTVFQYDVQNTAAILARRTSCGFTGCYVGRQALIVVVIRALRGIALSGAGGLRHIRAQRT